LFAQLSIRRRARLFELADFVVDLFQRLLQRFYQLVDRALTLVEIPASCFLKLFEVLACEIEKRLVVVSERIGRERFECVGKFLFRVGEQREFFLVNAAFVFKTCLES